MKMKNVAAVAMAGWHGSFSGSLRFFRKHH